MTMKKNYIKPIVSIVDVELENILAASDPSVWQGDDVEDPVTDAKPVIGSAWDTWE